MNVNGSDMLNYDNFALFRTNGGVCGSTWGQNKELEFL